MKTLLDEFHTSLLQSAVYPDEQLRILILEAMPAAKPDDIVVAGHLLKGSHAVEATENSRLIEICFEKPIAWQLVQERLTQWDDDEERDDMSRLQVLTRSKYFDYVNACHGWYEADQGPARHYRVWTEWAVVDIIASQTPTIDFVQTIDT